MCPMPIERFPLTDYCFSAKIEEQDKQQEEMFEDEE
jgi:hypothetical protein